MSYHIFPEAGPSSLVMKRATPAETWTEARKYAVIVDAGSSGSRLQVYSWRDPDVERTQRTKAGKSAKILPTVEKGTFSSDKDWQLKVEPGLSSFGTHPDDLGAYLAPLFQHAKSIIPADALASTPVYVLATAGMRLLPDEQRAAVLKETCQYIQHSTPFKLSGKGCEDHVQVITGEEEGLLGWIAINYLMDGFKFRPAGIDATSGQSTYGFLDMGGASTQIAFEPSKAAQAAGKDKEDLSPVTLRMLDGTAVVHDVFVTTFLGYGTNKARDRYVQALAAKGATSLSDPCLPAGLELSTSDKKLVGTGSFDNCLKQLSPLLEKNAACTRPPCLFHGVHVPAIDFSVNHFIGVSEYWFSSNDVYSLGGAYDFVAFQKAAQQFCGRTWKELEADLKKGDVFGKQVNEDRLELQCFKSAWMATVLHEGIGLPRIIDQGGKGDGRKHANDASDKASEKNLFQSVNDVNGLSVSWTLGKAVLEASRNIAPSSAAADTPIGLPANASDVKEVAMVPIQADSGIVQYKEQYDWSNQSEALLNEAKDSVVEHRYVTGAVIFFLLASLLLCCVRRRRRGGSAKRKETRLSKLWPSFLSRQQATSGRGDYTLANMEEGHDLAQLDGKTGRALGSSANTASIDSALPSTSESSGDEREADDKRRRAKRPANIITSLVVPIQRAALALGIKSAETPVATTSRRGHTRRLTSSTRVPMRYNASATPVSTSQPVSPRGQSRPSSRTGLMRSPRSAGHDKSFLLRQASSTQQMASPSLATTSAMNSRASSPAFGHASVVTARPNTPGVLATNLGSPFYAPAASQRHNSATSAFASIATGGATTPVSRSAASTPTSAISYFPPQLQTGGHFAQQQHIGATSRYVPQRAASSMSHFARGAWEDD